MIPVRLDTLLGNHNGFEIKLNIFTIKMSFFHIKIDFSARLERFFAQRKDSMTFTETLIFIYPNT